MQTAEQYTADSVAKLALNAYYAHATTHPQEQLCVGDLLLVGARCVPVGTNRFADRLFAYALDGRRWDHGQPKDFSPADLTLLGRDRGALFTTSPGLSVLQTWLRHEGIPVVRPGFYWRSYGLGRHGHGQRRHRAFVQCGVTPLAFNRWLRYAADDTTPVAVPAGTFHAKPTVREHAGLNIHAAALVGDSPALVVGAYSAGCQVVQSSLSPTYDTALQHLRRLQVARETAYAQGQKYDALGQSNARTFAHYLLIDRSTT